VLEEGFNFVNPAKSWTHYDCRQKTVKFDGMKIQAQDQQVITMDISVQYRADKTMTDVMKRETGNVEDVINVHLTPKARSMFRETGKSFERLEDFFVASKQQEMQTKILDGLNAYITPKGIIIDAVMVRNITPPAYIQQAIQSKKVRQQKAEEQEAELIRFEVEQQQKVKTAEAEKNAAREEAEKLRILADARAYEIEQINKAIAKNPAYIQLESIKAMVKISENPASQIYFIDSQSTTPLPLMHLGQLPKK